MTINTETLDALIGRRVEAARTASGYPASEAAARLKLSEEDYLARETGKARFRSRDLSMLAGLFAVELRSLFEDENRTGATREFALADWIDASRRREGLNALLQLDYPAGPDRLSSEAA